MSSMTVQSEGSKKRQRRRQENRKKDSHATSWRPGFVVKLILMALVNALGIYIIFTAFGQGSWLLGGLMVALLLFIDWVYFSKRTLALKYLTPGLVFLLVFQVFTIVYTGYIAFTNYGHQHTLDKPKAINALLLQKLVDEDAVRGEAVRDGECRPLDLLVRAADDDIAVTVAEGHE